MELLYFIKVEYFPIEARSHYNNFTSVKCTSGFRTWKHVSHRCTADHLCQLCQHLLLMWCGNVACIFLFNPSYLFFVLKNRSSLLLSPFQQRHRGHSPSCRWYSQSIDAVLYARTNGRTQSNYLPVCPSMDPPRRVPLPHAGFFFIFNPFKKNF